MFIGIARFDFLVPGSTSLKDKRQVVKHLIHTMRSKFNVSSAEVDHEELRQRGTIGVCCVSNSSFHSRRMLHEIERFVRSQYMLEVVHVDIEVVNPEDA